jgi:hypothetical protein
LTPAFTLDEEAAALIDRDRPDDVGGGARNQTVLVQANSPEMNRGNTARYTANARPGALVQYMPGGSRLVHDGDNGFVIFPLVCVRCWYVWPASREEIGPPIDKLWQRPPKNEADWLSGGPIKDGLYYISGPRKGLKLEENWEIHGFVGGVETVFAFKGKSTRIGREMVRRCANTSLRMGLPQGGTKLVAGAPLTVWRITSTQEQGELGPYYVALAEFLGKLGDAAGPSYGQWKESETRRVDLLDELVAGGMPLLNLHDPKPMLEDRYAKRSQSRGTHDDDGHNPPVPPGPEPERTLADDFAEEVPF